MPSFDIASKVQWHEVDNALQQAQKEIAQRFDFKDTGTDIEKTKEGLVIESTTEDRAKAALTVLQEKIVRRKLSLRFFDAQDPQATGKGGSRILVKVKEGVETEVAKKIILAIKESKLKVQGSIQEAQVRVAAKNKDDLQKAIALMRQSDFGIELQYLNFRD